MHGGKAWVVLSLALWSGLVALPAAAQPAVAAGGVTEAASQQAPARRALRARPAGDRPYVYRGTASGDNLWDIAGAVVGPTGGSEAIDRNQVMVAIFRANPEAFPEGNLHRIQKGLDLTVPSRAQIREEDRSQAAALVAQHRRAYADRRTAPAPLYALPGRVSKVPATAGTAASSSSALAGSGAAVSGPGEPAAGLPGASGQSGPSWALAAGLLVLAGVVAVALRALSRRPATFETPDLDPLPDDSSPGADADAEDQRDRQRAEAAVASLYQEDLSWPEPSVPQESEPVPLPPGDPAGAAALSDALADAYEELERSKDAQDWRLKGSGAA